MRRCRSRRRLSESASNQGRNISSLRRGLWSLIRYSSYAAISEHSRANVGPDESLRKPTVDRRLDGVAYRSQRLRLRRNGGMSERKRQLRPVASVERMLYSREEAATALGMSIDTFERRVQPFIKVVPCGAGVLVPPEELRRWVRENARVLVNQTA
jgi:hypothetical protein